jgi:hypothetical protein
VETHRPTPTRPQCAAVRATETEYRDNFPDPAPGSFAAGKVGKVVRNWSAKGHRSVRASRYDGTSDVSRGRKRSQSPLISPPRLPDCRGWSLNPAAVLLTDAQERRSK